MTFQEFCVFVKFTLWWIATDYLISRLDNFLPKNKFSTFFAPSEKILVNI